MDAELLARRDLLVVVWEVMRLLGEIVDETEQSDKIDDLERQAQKCLQRVEDQLVALAAREEGGAR